MLMGLALFSAAGATGAILFLVHHMPVKTVLFLVGGLIENDQGTSNLDRSGGLATKRPLIAAFFVVPALSLAGLPPFSGFVAKLAVISAGIDTAATVAVVAALAAGALTLLSMAKIWLGVFWGVRPESATELHAPGNHSAMFAATGLAVAGTLTISLFAGTLFELSSDAANDLRTPANYIAAVLS